MRRAATRVLVGGLILLGTGDAGAYSAGISGRSGVGCGGATCHGTAASPGAAVTIAAPATVPPGTGADVSVSIVDPSVPTTGINQGGFNLRALRGSLSPIGGDPAVQKFSAAEVGHAAAGNDQRSWTVRWEPPAPVPTLCQFDLNAAANAVNGDGVPGAADHWNRASASILVDTSGEGAAPTVAIAVPAAGTAYLNGTPLGSPGTTIVAGSIQLEVHGNDDVGIAGVVFEDTDLGGTQPLGAANYAGMMPSGKNRFRLAWDTLGEPPGPHTLTATITDCSGTTTSVSAELIVL